MKRYINSSSIVTKCIIVDITVETVFEDIDASQIPLVAYNPKVSKQIEQSKIDILNDIAESAMNSVTRFGFNIVSHGQASNSYSYYIRFKLPKQIDVEYDYSEVLIIFRISDHTSNKGAQKSKTSAIVIRSFNMNNIGFNNSMQVILTIDHICEELSKGNFDILDKYAIDISDIHEVL